MRIVAYTTVLLAVLFCFGNCDKTSVYEQNTKTLDSLSGAINSVMKELSGIDTLSLQKHVSRFVWYKQFIRQNVNDTLNKPEADQLQQFYILYQWTEPGKFYA
jgi:hypothetical protein